jgi:tocopherol O-methyltransferase
MEGNVTGRKKHWDKITNRDIIPVAYSFRSIQSAGTALYQYCISDTNELSGGTLRARYFLCRKMHKLVEFYEDKTATILRKYGAGPLVHYHTGVMDEAPPATASPTYLRASLIASQENILRHASKAWSIKTIPFEDVLDVGCGLGGGAIFWAREFGAHVTAITIAPSHIALVREFAAQAEMESRVQPFLCDALQVPGESRFDAAVAIDSSSSFSRKPWFQRLARLLRPYGRVFIFDCFLGSPEYEDSFNRHWCAQIGSLAEYISAAMEAGFQLEMTEDVSAKAIYFWDTTIALMCAEVETSTLSESERTKLHESIKIHAMVRSGLLEAGLSHFLMSFRKA